MTMMQYDYIIVGAGISGCYLAYLLNKQHPERRILMLERE
jgi:L-2-hydroxyglutarate oxidase LhgO